MPRAAALAGLLAMAALAGCAAPAPEAVVDSYAALGFDGATWPDLRGAKVHILAYEAFGYAFDEARQRFENRTNATAELLTEPSVGKVLERALREAGSPSYDIVYGIDNVLLGRAIRGGVYEPYQPLLAGRLNASLLLAPGGMAWPVNHGYIAVNVDPRANLAIKDLDDVRRHADRFVAIDPRADTPGLGFLIATVATYGDASPTEFDYLDYWNELFRGGVTVAPTWTSAYVDRFAGGYGQFQEGTKRDKALVVSYTTSPAYEVHYGYDTLNANVLAPKATFHDIQTVGIARGTPQRAAAEAWVEFTLTDAFQELAAPNEAIYPAVDGINVTGVYQGRDPRPGTFRDAGFSYLELDAGVERWVRAWTDAYERARAG